MTINALNQLKTQLQSISQSTPEIVWHDSLGYLKLSVTDEGQLSIPDSIDDQIPVIYWKNNQSQVSILGFGAADQASGSNSSDCMKAFEKIQEKLTLIGNQARYFFGRDFFLDSSPSYDFSDFAGFQFILPQIEFKSDHKSIQTTCHLLFKTPDISSTIAKAIHCIDQLIISFTSSIHHKIPAPKSIQDQPTQREWPIIVQKIHQSIQNQAIQKIAIARKSSLNFAESINPFSLLNSLIQETQTGTIYFLKLHQSTFLGCSPETLFNRQAQQIISDSIAGTVNHSDSNSEDQLFSPKNKAEHHWVSQHIQNTLNEFCDTVQISPLKRIKAQQISHLHQQITGTLNRPYSDLTLINALHPTPAVGSSPKAQFPLIRSLEPFERGWYAAPIGWMGQDHTELIVAIRAALAHKNQLNIYSGVGVIADSNAADEWTEIIHKYETILSFFKKNDFWTVWILI